MGIVYKEFVPASHTVNSEYNCDDLRRLRDNVQRLRLELWRPKKKLAVASRLRTVSHFFFH
jgi:hypothetical protein